MPGQFHTAGTLIFGANAIPPMVAGHEIPPRPPHHGDTESLHRRHYVFPEPPLIAEWGALLVDATVNATAQMLDEVAVDVSVNPA